MIRVEELVADIKKNNPDYYGQMDDNEVYKKVRKRVLPVGVERSLRKLEEGQLT